MADTPKKDDALHHTDWKETPDDATGDPVDPNTENRSQEEANSHQGGLDIEPPKGERAPGLK